MRPLVGKLEHHPYFIDVPQTLISLEYSSDNKTKVYWQETMVMEINYSFSLFEPEKAYLKLEFYPEAISHVLEAMGTPLISPVDSTLVAPTIPVAYGAPLSDEDTKQLVRLGFDMSTLKQVDLYRSPATVVSPAPLMEAIFPPVGYSAETLAKLVITAPYWPVGGSVATTPAAAISRGRMESFFGREATSKTGVGRKREAVAEVAVANAGAGKDDEEEVRVLSGANEETHTETDSMQRPLVGKKRLRADRDREQEEEVYVLWDDEADGDDVVAQPPAKRPR